MKIINGSEKYIEVILNLCKECSLNMTNKLINQWDEIYPNKEIFLHDIQNNSLYIAVTDDGEEIMGCIVLNEYQDPEYNEVKWNYTEGKIAVIHRLMIHPKHEGKGIAQDLVKFIEELAIIKQYAAIRLDVFINNSRAVNFYNKLGYQIAGKVNFRKGEFFCCEKAI